MIGRAMNRVNVLQLAILQLAILLLAVALVAACSSGGQGPRPSLEPSSSPSGSPTPEGASSPGPGVFVRTCDMSVYGELGRGWREDENTVVVGPLAFLYPGGYADAPKRSFDRRGAGYPSQKVLIVVEQGAAVTVAIASRATEVASLLYDPEAFEQSGVSAVSDGARAVTFIACPKGTAAIGPPNAATQFNGGFIVSGPRCVPIEVRVGDNPTPDRRVFSFGKGDCAPHSDGGS
jgi:hypothetical protein